MLVSASAACSHVIDDNMMVVSHTNGDSYVLRSGFHIHWYRHDNLEYNILLEKSTFCDHVPSSYTVLLHFCLVP